MSFINKVSNILKHDQNNVVESEDVQKVLLLNFALIIVASLNLIFSIGHFFFFERPVSYILFLFFLGFLFLFLFFKYNKNYHVISFISSILITLLFIFVTFIGAGNKTGILWGLTYPIIVSFAFGIKKSNYFSLIFLFLTLIIFFVPFDFFAEYPIDIKLRYTGAYIAIFVFLQYFIRIKQQVFNYKEKKLIETQQKLHEKEKMLSKLSYQIRTPLNNIAGIINLKRDSLDDEIVEEAELSISNLVTIINSIPDLSDNHILKIKGDKSLFSINSTIKKSVTLFQTDKYKNLKFSLNLSNKVPNLVYGNRLIILQIIISVIDFFYNNKNNGILKIDLISDKKNDDIENITIEIKSYFNYSFLKSFVKENLTINIEETKNKEMLLIFELTNILNSNIILTYNEEYTSFFFTFNFPKKENIKQERTEVINNINKGNFFNEREKKDLKDATVLLVEDDIMNSKVMTLNIKKYVNKIIIAENGKDALEKYASTKIDIILMDIRMPLMDGFKTTEKIREAEVGTGIQTPIIAVTANASSDVKQKCLEVGMNDYTTKPTNFKLLIKKMKAQLS